MQAIQIAGLTLFAVGMSIGQMLFKLSADRLGGGVAELWRLLVMPSFIAAILLYGTMTVLWVYMLTRVPLSFAYPFLLLSFALTPVLAHFVFGDPLPPRLLLGLGLVVGGLAVLAR